MVRGLSHMTFIVSDLDRTEALFTAVLGARKVYESGGKTYSLSRERFFLVGGEAGDPNAPAPIWLVIMEGTPLPSRTYNHVAFKIEEADYGRCVAHLRRLGLEMTEGRSRIEGEGRSIYFHDYDNHLFELHTGTLGERLDRYALEQ